MATSGQTLNDRINAARYALAGQGLARCVCKATTEEVIGPKKKHLDYLLACTHEPNVSIPQLANLLIERTNHIYWVVVFKALVTVHHLMSYGNERFTQYLASSNYSFELSTFLDKTAARDFSMSTFIRRYSRYINEKALSYRLLAFDFCKVKRGNEGVLRVMPIDRLLKTLPILQNQLDALLEFDCNANDLNNGVINACFMLLFRDLIGLFACHNDGIINLLNKYFTLNRKMCREAFDLYKKFLVRMDKVSDFLRVAEVVGIDKDEIPDLRRAPSSLIEALEQHLQNIESNKKILKQQSSNSGGGSSKQQSSSSELNSVLGNLTPPSSRRPNSPGSSALTSTGAATSGGSQSDEFSINSFKDEEVRKALEEEARVLSQYGSIEAGGPAKSSASKSKSSVTGGNGAGSPKFAVTTIPKSIDDIFGDSDAFATTANTTTSSTNNNGFGESKNLSSFDNLSTTSSSSSTAKQRPDLESIKSTIKSATTTLEKSSGSSSALKGLAPPPSGKKASDDLFGLLDAPTSTTLATSDGSSKVASGASSSSFGGPPKSQTLNLQTNPILNANPISPFASTSPFDILAPMDPIGPQTNGGQMSAKLKPGNPFPEVGGDFASNTSSAFLSTVSTGAGTSAFAAVSATPIQPSMPTSGNSVFKSTTSSSTTTTANYTNLGGLEGFGDLLQPMSSSTNNNNNKGINHGGSNMTQLGAAKPSFNSGSGLASTGLFKGDLDSTLANLAQNLTFDGITKTKK